MEDEQLDGRHLREVAAGAALPYASDSFVGTGRARGMATMPAAQPHPRFDPRAVRDGHVEPSRAPAPAAPPSEVPDSDAYVAAAYAAALRAAGLDPARRTVSDHVRRAIDVTVAILVLALGSPVLLALIVAVRLESPGRAIFRQRRVGRGLQPFTLLKMRTLYADARERYPELYRYEFSREEIRRLQLRDLKTPDDPRVTKLGTWLRRSSLDELPNFVNLLKGEMTLVGPRPELVEFLRFYEGDQLLKFAVRPGITGLAQVSGRNGNSFQGMIRLDIDYVRRRTLLLDLQIVLRTIVVVFNGRGAW
jgi:lipopolysaccharide/colanic/teichoic acid biosynthesis glycosyltransferase